jgi:hypothetical protein
MDYLDCPPLAFRGRQWYFVCPAMKPQFFGNPTGNEGLQPADLGRAGRLPIAIS